LTLDYVTSIRISTDASLREMLAPRALVMLGPLIIGMLFEVDTLVEVLVRALISLV
jgi:H+-translocating diphosphatase